MKINTTFWSAGLGVLLTVLALNVMANSGFTPADEHGRSNYLITFAESGLLAQHQQRSTGQRFDFNASSIVSARAQLQAEQAGHLSRMASTLGRNVAPSHYYLISHSGVAARLTPDEARRVRAMPGVINIERERQYELSTYRGPTFIGTDGIWTGEATPSGDGFEGRGMIAAILDTGIVPSHASFINDPACGHGDVFPNKVLSSLDCASTDANGLCNGASPTDTNGHGSHTASTVAGNRVQPGASPSPTIPSPFTEISGVAPCAHVRSYKTCPANNCPGADLQAGLNSVLIHGDADAVNYSISGGLTPWTDFDRIKLDMVGEGIFVAASAGNTSATITNPVGQVNHRGPWVTTVAASTRDGNFSGEVVVDGITYAADPGSDSPVASNLVNHPIRYDAAQPAGADGCVGFPANFFDGAIALVQRGTCAFTDKINNAAAAGADLVLIWNNVAGAFGMSTPGQDPNTPAYGITQAAGTAIRNFIDAQAGSATADFNVIPSQGDVLAGFSFRGPTPGALANLQKPDITAPGVDIYAAVPGGYANISGTSMSGPHVAGAGLLVAQVRPDWTPSEIKSAIQMSASKAGTKENGSTSWDWDDVGHGRADLMGAALAGLVLDETFANYLAANPANGGDVRTLNLAGLRDRDCSPDCTWTRTVRNTLDTPSSWTATSTGVTANMNIEVSPSTFSFTGDPSETQVLTIIAAPVDDLSSTIGFGEIVFAEDTEQSPDLHFTVAIQGEPGQTDIPVIDINQNEFNFVMNPDDVSTQTLTISNIGTQPLDWLIEEAELASVGRGAFNPELDEVLSLADFVLPGGGTHNTTATGGVSSSGEVIGFTFAGTVSGITGTGTWASDAQLNMTSPDSQTFQVGGFLGDNPWDFDGVGSADDGTYTSTHFGAFADAEDAGTWDFGFVHTWNDPMTWTNVSITLHKTGDSGPCADPAAISWLSVVPAAGTTAASDSDEVDVIVDSDGLAEGNYQALLCLSSNDPNNGLIEIPVSLTVIDGTIEPATIDVDVASFSFDLISGESDSDNMVISNIGDELLSWNITTATNSFAALPRGGNIVVFDNINYVVSNTVDGSSFNWFTGDICDCDTNPGFHFNPWSSGGNLSFWWWSGTDNRAGVSLDGTTYAALGADDTVGPASTFISEGFPTGTVNWRQAGNVDGYLGFRFINPNTTAINYGYVHIATTGTTGHPATVVGWAFDQTGAAITIPGAAMPDACDNPANIPWLSASPNSGSLTGGNSANVSVNVDATGLASGNYEALLCVNSNDPTNPIVEIPVSLDVTGPAEIDVDPTSISMTLETGDSDSTNLLISNLGESILNWEVDESASSAGMILRASGSVTIPAAIGGQSGSGFASFSGSFGNSKGVSSGTLNGAGVTITHSDSDSVLAANAVACSPDGGVTTSENFYLRTFTLADFGITDTFNVSEVAFGIENLSSDQPITVNLYSLDGAFTFANMTLIGTATQSVASQQLTIVTVPVEGSIAAEGTLVVEIAPPDLSGVAAFFPGSNNAGETAPSYIASPACSINEPATYGSIGFPQVQLVMSVTGTVGAGVCEIPSWMSVNPLSGSVAAAGDQAVSVTLDADGLSFGTYEANICIASNDPVNPLVQVPVTLEVPLGADAAILEGTVSSLGYCSANTVPAAGALIEVTSDARGVFTATTDANGFYQMILDVNESPVSITASAPGHITGIETGVNLVAEGTVVVDFDMVLEAACATVAPGSLSANLASGQSSVQMVEIGNTDGAADLEWTIFSEAVNSRAHFPAVPYMAAAGNSEGASLLADEAAVAGGSTAAFDFPLGMGVPGFTTTGFTADGYVSLDALVPGTLNLINATQPTNIFAATFIDNDFSQQYMLASANGTIPVNTFGVTDTSTGVFTSLGTVTGGGAGSWSSMKWDHGTGTLYAVNAAGGNNVLYTIDLDTLVATQVGVITGAGVDPGVIVIAIAISPDGLMYGIDIIADVLLAIDKESAEASVIGPLGVNANFAQDMDFDQSDGTLYWAGYLGGGNSQMYIVNLATGAATSLGNIGGGNELLSFSIAIEGAGAGCQAPSAVPWLSIDPLSGTTGAGDTDMVEVVLDSSGLAGGVYEAFVCVETNDANNDQIAIPVTLNVAEDIMFQDRFEQ
jgi:hypothetical protein